jgi:3',5'-cyclic AMP phosphodiesterase CpdA
MASSSGAGRLLAISDLHVRHPDNRAIVADLQPTSEHDWLLVAGDVADLASDVEWTLARLAERFARVVWTPGNHELWTLGRDPVQLRGEERYRYLVDAARRMGVVTPEDPYPVWEGPGGPVTIAPLLLLYDYTFRPEGTSTKQEALAKAYQAGVVCTDEAVLFPDGHSGIDAWCRARVAETERRLAACDRDKPLVLVNHYPLVREPTRVLRYPEFALWCGTTATADWHRRFRTAAVVYGHLHIPRTTWHDGVRFEEVSLGYPREWRHRSALPGQLREVLPEYVRQPQ